MRKINFKESGAFYFLPQKKKIITCRTILSVNFKLTKSYLFENLCKIIYQIQSDCNEHKSESAASSVIQARWINMKWRVFKQTQNS